MKVSACLLAVCGLAVPCAAVRASAQQSAAQPDTASAVKHSQLNAYRRENCAALIDDFGQLGRYRAANAALGPPKDGERRVLFLGDSITDAWRLEQFFPGKGYIDRGISGQTTSQMLVRFRQDVIDLKPRVLVILAGTNDIAGNTGPISMEDIERNYATMAELARAHNIAVIFASVTPVNGDVPDKHELFDTRPPAKILELNAWLKRYCAANGEIYLDYFSALADERGLLRDALSPDGLHPNVAGYKIMAPLAQSAIDKALLR